jgi:deoxyguanosine kinase
MMHHHIVVEGPIGVGKTTLARMLAEELGARLVAEALDENPLLPRFYEDPEGQALQTQLFFLVSRFRQQQVLSQLYLREGPCVCDYLFAKDRLFADLNLAADELTLYRQIYQLLSPQLARPDLVVYLQASTEELLRRIHSRAIPYERGIDKGYVERVNEAYKSFFFDYDESPLLVINTTDINFVDRREDFDDLLHHIREVRAGTVYYQPLSSRE